MTGNDSDCHTPPTPYTKVGMREALKVLADTHYKNMH